MENPQLITIPQTYQRFSLHVYDKYSCPLCDRTMSFRAAQKKKCYKMSKNIMCMYREHNKNYLCMYIQ